MRAGLWIGGGLAGAALVAALISLVWTPYDVTALSVTQRLKPPSAAHWFGSSTQK